ncbi:hypothetical protein OSTOST_08241, partial [Ostertagia ostertagi]
MAYFRSFFGGGGAEAEEEDGAEIVEKMVERAETCTALEDRRDALRALRGMAKKLRLAVGTMGMNVYMDVLEKERSNQELLAITLEILVAVLSSDDESTDDDELGERLAEVMLKKPVFIPSLLTAVDDYDITVRRVGIQLLTSLLRHRGPEVQAAVMAQPTGVPHLVDIVHDRREVVRNEAVLMLCELSRSNSQIQQLLAYENAFVHLLDIIDTEPLDSIIIEDCLFVILNLLRKNAMNQQLFRENNLIARLGVMLNTFLYGSEEDETDSLEWVKQRTANIIFLLQVIRSLVSPDNAVSNTHAAQKALHQTSEAITSSESVQCWFGCVSLLYCLLDVEHLREQLLRVQVSMGNRRVRMRAGVLMLLSTWLKKCPSAVAIFLENEDNLHYLTTQILDDCGEGTESEQQVLKGLMAFLLLVCLENVEDANQ